jgi:hypothetical protein
MQQGSQCAALTTALTSIPKKCPLADILYMFHRREA